MTCICVRNCDCEKLPADWAIKKALKAEYGDKASSAHLKRVKTAPNGTFYKTVVGFARYIEQHEEPPVDPDLILARKLCAESCKDETVKQKYLLGHYDSLGFIKIVSQGIKEGRKLGSE